MKIKKCFKCGKTKPITEFYRHGQMKDGHLNKCKECTKKDAHEYREENIDTVREYDRKRANLPHRIEARKEYAVLHKKEIAGYKEAWRSRNKEKARAYRILGYNVRRGYIEKKACEHCGEKKTEAHHEDYSKPLEVIWLCDSCHKKLHKEMSSDV